MRLKIASADSSSSCGARFPHTSRAAPEPAPAPDAAPGDGWDRRIAGGLAFLRRRITGDYEVDDFGFDADLTEHVLLPPLRPLYGLSIVPNWCVVPC